MRTSQRTLLTLCIAALALLAGSRDAHATDEWRTPYPGVRQLHRTDEGIDYHVVLVDLRDPRIELVATHPADRFTTTSDFARHYEADIAINANFFNHASCGLMAGGGEVSDNAYDDNCRASLGFGRENEAAVFDSLEIPRGPLPAAWMTEVLSGKPFLLRDGRAPSWVRPQHLYRPNPRTVVGLTRDRHTLVLLVADGRRGRVTGLTGFQLVAALREFGVTDAINLDGGGSSVLVVGGRVQNHPSDHRERVVISHLGIRVHEGAAWHAAAIIDHGASSSAHDGDAVRVWLEARNLGRAVWHAEGEGGGSPVLELDDGLVQYIARVRETTAPGDVARFELNWLARGRGVRHLRAVLRAADGTVLDAGNLGWDVAVIGHDATPVRPQRASATARATEMVLPAGMGALTVRAGNCGVGPARSVRFPSAWLLAAIFAIARRRRARR